jgi:hypothetical protein
LEKFLGAKMKCEMPDCQNESLKKVSKSGIFYGICLDDHTIMVCNDHTINEINERINNSCAENSLDQQMCNPFADALLLKKSGNFV